MSDLKDELEQERREKEWAETWKPDGAGDMLIGTLEGYDEATTDFGTYTVAHVRDENGVLRGLWLMHSVLQDEWKEAAPEVGDRVGVQYLGKRSGEDFDYHMWSARVDRSESDSSDGSTDAGSDRAPQDGEATGGEGRPQDFDGSDLWGKPALDEENSDGGESTMDDPNGALPF